LRPRTILYTGKGGVGKTSVAAATGRRCAAAGQRTIVLSTDPAHSLAESLEVRVGAEPTDVGGGLWAQQVQAQDELERNWSAVQGWLGGLFVDQASTGSRPRSSPCRPAATSCSRCCRVSATSTRATGMW